MADYRVWQNRRPSPYGIAFGAGVLAAFVCTVIMAICRGLGWTEFNAELMLGSWFGIPPSAGAWIWGFIFFTVIGGIVGMIYAAAFNSGGRVSAGVGAGYSMIHWVVTGIFLGLVSAIHPYIPEVLADPGWFASNLGAFAFFLVLGCHLVYGSIVGSIYQQSAGQVTVRTIDEEERRRRVA